jgi:hypothetical protein
MIEWLMIGGPQHGRWRLASSKPYAVRAPGRRDTDYAVQNVRFDGRDISEAIVRVTVATPPRPILYYPERVKLDGWRVLLMAYVEAGISAGARKPEPGSILPGSVVGAPRDLEVACRWCYGRPMPDMDVCSRVSCITAVSYVASLDVLTADDAADWGQS